jgi:hypothetical protein
MEAYDTWDYDVLGVHRVIKLILVCVHSLLMGVGESSRG